MQKNLLNWTQQNRAYGGDTLMMSLKSGTMAKCTTDTSPQHHHTIMFTGEWPMDQVTFLKTTVETQYKEMCGVLIHVNVYQKATHTRKCLCQRVATHSPALLIHSIQRLSTWENDFKTRSEQLKIYLLVCGSNKCTCTYCVLLLYLERKLSSPTHPNKPPITY